MTDAEIRGRLLTHLYALRHNDGGWVPISDIILSPERVELRVIGGVCQQLADIGLILWKPLRGSNGLAAGTAKITGQGVAAVESGRSADIDIRFPSNNETAPNVPSSEEDLFRPLPEKMKGVESAASLQAAVDELTGQAEIDRLLGRSDPIPRLPPRSPSPSPPSADTMAAPPSAPTERRPEIFQARPGFMGFSVDLKAAWFRYAPSIQRWWKSKS